MCGRIENLRIAQFTRVHCAMSPSITRISLISQGDLTMLVAAGAGDVAVHYREKP